MISTRTRYAGHVLFDLGLHPDRVRSLREIARDRRLPRRYVAILMRPLQKAGIVEAFPGPKGGFRLKRAPSEINTLELIDIMDRPINLAHCQKDPAKCQWQGRCVLASVWRRTSERIRAIFAEETLELALRDYRKNDAGQPGPKGNPKDSRRPRQSTPSEKIKNGNESGARKTGG